MLATAHRNVSVLWWDCLLDASGPGSCSLQDMVVTVAGGILGVAWNGWMLSFSGGRPQIVHAWELK